jgi:hypothetical protein
MAVIDKVTLTNDEGTTYATVGEAIAALEKANSHIFDTYKAMEDLANSLGRNTIYKIQTETPNKEIRVTANEGDEIDDWPAHTYESHKHELTPDSTGWSVTRVWTDEMWTNAQSIPAPTIGNGWTRTATVETVSDEISVINESL